MTAGERQYRTAIWVIASVVAFLGLLGGAVGLWHKLGQGDHTPPAASPSPWPETGRMAIRKVPMPTGELAAALPVRTAGQVLCNALPEAIWAKLLGGPVEREADGLGICTVVTTTITVRIQLTALHANAMPAERARVSVAGRTGALVSAPGGAAAGLVVPLVDGPRAQQPWLKPYLHVDLLRDDRADGGPDLRRAVRDLGEGIINAITAPGLELPEATSGKLPSRQVGPVAGSGITDSSYPMIAWQLCTQLAASSGRPLEDFQAGTDGGCELTVPGIRLAAAYVDLGLDHGEYPETLAGRPARQEGHSMLVKLTDDSSQAVRLTRAEQNLSDEDLRTWAASLVPPLLGR